MPWIYISSSTDSTTANIGWWTIEEIHKPYDPQHEPTKEEEAEWRAIREQIERLRLWVELTRFWQSLQHKRRQARIAKRAKPYRPMQKESTYG